MSGSIPSVQCGVSYFPPLLRDDPSLKEMRQNALVDRLFKFHIQVSSSSYKPTGFPPKYVTDSFCPKDEDFIQKVTGWLNELAKSETGFQLLAFIEKNSTDPIIIARGEETCVFKQNDTIMLLIDRNNSYKRTIIQLPTGEMEERMERGLFGFAHELVHIRHMIQGIFSQNLRKKYPHGDLYFSNAEEMLTVMGYANYGTERLKDPISENTIRQDLLAPKRVAHVDPYRTPAYLGLDGTLAYLIENDGLGSENHLKAAMQGACAEQMSRKGNHTKVIELLIQRKSYSANDLRSSIAYLLDDADAPPKLRMSLLKMLGTNLFHDVLENDWFTLRMYKKWVYLIVETEKAKGVKNLLHTKNSQEQTVLQIVEKLAEGKLIAFFKALEKECRYTYPSLEQLFSITST